MEVQIRDSLPSDVEAIYQIRCDSRLSLMQYAVPAKWQIEAEFSAATPGLEIPQSSLKCTTIEIDGAIAGHITQRCTTDKNEQLQMILGWNLHPDYWGKGLMVVALKQLLRQRFEVRSDLIVCACCFKSNQRCRRVIEKLGFTLDKLSVSEWLGHFCMHWGFQKVLKHRLTYDQFCSQQSAT